MNFDWTAPRLNRIEWLLPQTFPTRCSASLSIASPVLHARNWLTQPTYSTIDQWADFLPNDSSHVSRSRHASHDKLAFLFANLASRAGVYSSTAQCADPQAEADCFRRGDIVTFAGGLCSRSASY
jgi:hypothetical protein